MKRCGVGGILVLATVCLLPKGALAHSAVAFDKGANKVGYCYSRPNGDEAGRCALAECARAGGKACEIVNTLNTDLADPGGYSAVATGKGMMAVKFGATTEKDASEGAYTECARQVAGCSAEDGDEEEKCRIPCDYEDALAGKCTATCAVVGTWYAEPGAAGPLPHSPKAKGKTVVRRGSGGRTADPAKPFIAQGNALLKEKRYGEALVAYTRAIDANPDADAAWQNRGLAYLYMGPTNYDAARRDFDKAISINPENHRAYYNRGIVNKRSGNELAYLNDLKTAARLGNKKARTALSKLDREGRHEAASGQQGADGKRQTEPPAGKGEEGRVTTGQTAADPRGNAVEPISNGLLLVMGRNEVRQKFGDPKASWITCQMDYDGFSVDTCYGPHIARVVITGPGVTLNSGVGVGSSKADVARVFTNPYGGTTGQYALDFSYSGDRVTKIKIEPADGEFKAYAASSAPSKKNAATGGRNALVGTWHGTATTVGTIEIRGDGTYSYNGSPGGRWTTKGEQIVFDGSLAAWGGGRATLKGGNLEFSWKSTEGWNQWFSFAK